jgi:hypothetical protein
MTVTEQEQAACGRMGYSLRCLVTGWRAAGEEHRLILRALFNEAISLCLSAVESRLGAGQALFAEQATAAWETIVQQNPHLSRGHEEGGN